MDTKLRKSALQNEYFLSVVRQMMFIQGDAEDPLDENINRVLDLVKFQLIKVMEDSFALIKTKKQRNVSVKEIVFVFRRHKQILSRLLSYVKTANAVRSISDEAQAEPTGKNSDTEDEILDDDDEMSSAAKRAPGGSLLEELENAINDLGADYNSSLLEKLPDPVNEGRKLRMAGRAQMLNSEQYERFSEARKASFYSAPKRNKESKLVAWLGIPSISNQLELILGFIAKETVALYVEDALTVREQEPAGLFKNEGSTACIQQRHYEEALRRNLGFRYRRDFLFGYY